MRTSNLLITIALSSFIASCASDRVIVDQRGLNQAKYERDLAECQAYKEQVNTGQDIVEGAAVGAVIGGAIGAILDKSHGAGEGAGVGAVHGATKKGISSSEEKQRVVKNCMRGRGYRILN